MNFKSLVIILLVFLGTYQSSQAQKIEYYRHLVFHESPYSDINGIYPLSGKEAEGKLTARKQFNAAMEEIKPEQG